VTTTLTAIAAQSDVDRAFASLRATVGLLEDVAPIPDPSADALTRMADAGLWVAQVLTAAAGDQIEAAGRVRGFAEDGLAREQPDDLREVLAELAAAQLCALVKRQAALSEAHRSALRVALAGAVAALCSTGVLADVAAA
jgi:hypothetical protein